MPIPSFVTEDLTRLDLNLADSVIAQLDRYLDLLLDANQHFNLTGIRDRDLAWRRLVIDSLTPLPWLDEIDGNPCIVDVGSGGGLPGLVLAIARPDWRFTLIEATGKKANFLKDCVRDLGLAHVRVAPIRAEDAGQDPMHRQRYDAAVCRAVGRMAELAEYTLPLVRVGGSLLAMKGPGVEQELDAAGDAMMLLGGGELAVYDAYPEGFDQNTVIVIVQKAAPTPKAYPRRPGVPRMTPL